MARIYNRWEAVIFAAASRRSLRTVAEVLAAREAYQIVLGTCPAVLEGPDPVAEVERHPDLFPWRHLDEKYEADEFVAEYATRETGIDAETVAEVLTQEIAYMATKDIAPRWAASALCHRLRTWLVQRAERDAAARSSDHARRGGTPAVIGHHTPWRANGHWKV